jgi:hypothetical protein
MNHMHTPSEALAKREAFHKLIAGWPPFLSGLLIRYMTWLTGLAPSAPVPNRHLTPLQVHTLTLSAIAFGLLLLPTHPLLAAPLLIYGMRSFSSVAGHHQTHTRPVNPLGRFLYDAVSAILTLPSFAAYATDHQKHHAFAAGPRDPDLQFIAGLGARFQNLCAFLATLLDPVFHFRFAQARLTAAMSNRWRTALTLTAASAIAFLAPIAGPLTIGLLYQLATTLQWATEHRWGHRPEGPASPADIATAVTFGRLLIPSYPPKDPRFWLQLLGYTAARILFLSGDLANHDLHHIGYRGSWTESASLRTRLILEGKYPQLQQTVSLRGMFTVAFESAAAGLDRDRTSPLALREMPPEMMLGM